MTLDEVSALVNEIKSAPIEYVIMDIEKHQLLIKYTKHSKRLEKHINNLRILEEFKELYDITTKQDNNALRIEFKNGSFIESTELDYNPIRGNGF